MMSADALQQELDIPLDLAIDIDENDVKEIIESIKEAQYFDASSMAPLTPASAVSTLSQLCT